MTSAAFYADLTFGLVLTILAYFGTRWMWRHGNIIDTPNQRSSHKRPLPRSGGVVIVLTFLLGMIYILRLEEAHLVDKQYYWAFVLSSLLIAGVSLWDDMHGKTAGFKLVTHVAAVVIVLASGIVIDNLALPWSGYASLGAAGYVVSFLWILGLSNAMNFMDGIDGLVAGTAVISSLFFMAISHHLGSSFVYITGYAILAGALGFLFWNFQPAKIFMGDVGSVFLGFVLAVLAIIAAKYDTSRVSFLVMPLLVFNIIFDAVFTFIRRAIRGEKVMQAHRTHLYQLLVRDGFTHREVSLIHYCMAFLQGLGAMWMVQIPGTQRIFIFIPFVLLQAAWAWWVMRRSGHLLKESQP